MTFPQTVLPLAAASLARARRRARAAAVVNAYIEITPFDLVKYEIDKAIGLPARRPAAAHLVAAADALRLRSRAPTAASASARCCRGREPRRRRPARHLRAQRAADHPRRDPRSTARVIGGMQMLDRGEADDKIVAVLDDDYVWGDAAGHRATCRRCSSSACATTSRPTSWCRASRNPARVASIYGAVQAHKVVEAAMRDYEMEFGA